VFENYPECGERSCDFGQVGKEVFFRIQDRDVLQVSFPPYVLPLIDPAESLIERLRYLPSHDR
jgi:hypothetical protein